MRAKIEKADGATWITEANRVQSNLFCWFMFNLHLNKVHFIWVLTFKSSFSESLIVLEVVISAENLSQNMKNYNYRNIIFMIGFGPDLIRVNADQQYMGFWTCGVLSKLKGSIHCLSSRSFFWRISTENGGAFYEKSLNQKVLVIGVAT